MGEKLWHSLVALFHSTYIEREGGVGGSSTGTQTGGFLRGPIFHELAEGVNGKVLYGGEACYKKSLFQRQKGKKKQ